MNDENQKQLDDLVTDFCRRVQLYGCDAVQVLMSIHEEKGQQTLSKQCGRGNWYARKGLAQEFLDEDRTRTEEYIRQGQSDDNDEGWRDG